MKTKTKQEEKNLFLIAGLITQLHQMKIKNEWGFSEDYVINYLEDSMAEQKVYDADDCFGIDEDTVICIEDTDWEEHWEGNTLYGKLLNVVFHVYTRSIYGNLFVFESFTIEIDGKDKTFKKYMVEDNEKLYIEFRDQLILKLQERLIEVV